MNVYINGEHFTETPSSCGSCPFFRCGATAHSSGSDNGHCRLWDKMHHRWINPPAVCKKLFRRAAEYDNGAHLVIIQQVKQQ